MTDQVRPFQAKDDVNLQEPMWSCLVGAPERYEMLRLLSVEEVAEIVGLSADSARDLMKRLGHVVFGSRHIVKLEEWKLRRWIERGGDVARAAEDAIVTNLPGG